MSPEEKELLHRTVALAEENNDILRSIQRSMRFSHFMSVVYWVVIVGTALGAYYYFQPYIKEVQDVYGGAKSEFGSFTNMLNTFKQQPVK